jgi:CRISPR-associated protein Cas1
MSSHLLSRFLAPHNFELAWDKVASNQGCAGVDGETIYAFGQQKDRKLVRLLQQVAAGTYRPMPLRQLFIPKKRGGWRELRVPTVRDRIVQQALLQVLHLIMEAEFEPSSFAYRPGRSHLLAVEQVNRWRDRGYDWVLDADIVKYFDRIQHSRLVAEVGERLSEPWVLALVQSWIEAGVLTPAGIVLPHIGVPQGSVISPLLSNVYLDDFDAALAHKAWKLVRFADDFVVLARSRRQLQAGQTQVTQLLDAIGLELNADKTCLTHFDRGFRFLGHTFVGDITVQNAPRPASSTRLPKRATEGSHLRIIHAEKAEPTTIQRALVAALQASQQPIPPPLFVALGYQVRVEAPIEIKSKEPEWRTGMASLYVVEQGTYLQKEQGRFILKAPGQNESMEIPMREVERILVFGNIQLSTAVISSCLQLHIPVIFLSQLGEYKGHLWSAEITDLTTEAKQFERQHDQTFRLSTARAIVYGKLWNSKIFLLRQNRKRQLTEVTNAIERLNQAMAVLANPDLDLTLEQVRGYEGTGANQYFQTFAHLITNPGFSWSGRNFHPPTDPVNSLLSFGYTLLFNNVFSLLLAEGLNPYLGHLHGAERQKAYLAFDLMEEFRSPIVDTLVLRLINQKTIRPTDFTWPQENNGVYLTGSARRVFLKHFEQRINEPVSHPDVKEKVTYRRVIQLQVQRYQKALLGNHPYLSFQRVR